MSSTSFKSPSISFDAIAGGVFGLLMVLSVFLPWLAPRASISSSYSSSSGMNVSTLLGLTGIVGGLLAAVVAFIPLRGVKKWIHVLTGIAGLGVLALLFFNGMLPLRSAIVRDYVSTGFGVYAFVLSAFALVVIGIAEKSGSKRQAQPLPVGFNAPYANAPYTPSTVLPRYCSGCGHQVKAGVSFCGGCGAAVPAQAVCTPGCPGCGHEYSPGAGFCPACGVRLPPDSA